MDSDGLQIYFERFGAGPPMILAHGWGQIPGVIGLILVGSRHLKKHRTLISMDVRGHGKSDKPHALDPYSYAAMSHDVLVVMDVLKIAKTDVTGYSMGSFTGVHLLGHYPEQFTAMVLGGIGDETELSAVQGSVIAQVLRAPDLSSISNPAGKNIRKFVESNPNNDLELLAYSTFKMWPEGYPIKIASSNIAQARLPVLIVDGENEHPYVQSADQLAAVLPNCNHRRIPGTDHLTTVSDDRFNQAVIDFITSHKHSME